jgi:hypothetical protein
VQRFRVPELVLGFLFATLVWAAIFVIYPQYSGAKTYAHSSAEQKTENVSDAENTDDRIARYTLWLTLFTGILAVSTIGLWGVTWRAGIRQSHDMERAIIESRRSADVAMQSLRSDRAWMILFNRQAYRADTLHVDGAPIGPGVAVSLQWMNMGRSPALHASLRATQRFVSAHQAVPFFPTDRSAEAVERIATVGPGGVVATSSLAAGDQILEQVKRREMVWYIYSTLIYRTIFSDVEVVSEACVTVEYNGDIRQNDGMTVPNIVIGAIGPQNTVT